VRALMFIVLLSTLGCEPIPPYSVKTVERAVRGTDGMTLIAEDGAECRTIDYTYQQEMIWRAEVGEPFGCNWHPKGEVEVTR